MGQSEAIFNYPILDVPQVSHMQQCGTIFWYSLLNAPPLPPPPQPRPSRGWNEGLSLWRGVGQLVSIQKSPTEIFITLVLVLVFALVLVIVHVHVLILVLLLILAFVFLFILVHRLIRTLWKRYDIKDLLLKLRFLLPEPLDKSHCVDDTILFRVTVNGMFQRC
jgi:hypothetical protein